MSRPEFLTFLLWGFALSAAFAQNQPFRVAFGSCGHESDPLPIFNRVVEHKADVFVFLGDNIYGDSKVMDTLRAKYQRLGSKSSYLNLKRNVEIIATWDDHDFGWNDAGKEYPFKEESKEIFLDFFDEPSGTDRRSRAGIYTSYDYIVQGRKVKIILLDGRTFRDPLRQYAGEFDADQRYFYQLDYAPHPLSETPAFLGEEQWAWLERELLDPADLRIIGSGTQFGIEFNGYEAWANFPREQQRMLELIKRTKAQGVLFISGDVHYAEISKLTSEGLYSIYDITASGLSSTWHFATPNRHRIEGPIMDNHFGMLSIDFDDPKAQIRAEIWDIHDNQRVEYSISLDELRVAE